MKPEGMNAEELFREFMQGLREEENSERDGGFGFPRGYRGGWSQERVGNATVELRVRLRERDAAKKECEKQITENGDEYYDDVQDANEFGHNRAAKEVLAAMLAAREGR